MSSSYPSDWKTRAKTTPWWVHAHGTRQRAIQHKLNTGQQDGPLFAPMWYILSSTARPIQYHSYPCLDTPVSLRSERCREVYRDEQGWHDE